MGAGRSVMDSAIEQEDGNHHRGAISSGLRPGPKTSVADDGTVVHE